MNWGPFRGATVEDVFVRLFWLAVGGGACFMVYSAVTEDWKREHLEDKQRTALAIECVKKSSMGSPEFLLQVAREFASDENASLTECESWGVRNHWDNTFGGWFQRNDHVTNHQVSCSAYVKQVQKRTGKTENTEIEFFWSVKPGGCPVFSMEWWWIPEFPEPND